MASMRLVQNGATGKRPLVIVYHAASAIDEKLRVACGSYPCVLNWSAAPMKKQYAEVGKNGLQAVADVAAEWLTKVGAVEFYPIVLVGFSEGCQAVRAQLLHDIARKSTAVDGVVAIDGVHSSKPIPTQGSVAHSQQIYPWKYWLTFGKSGEDKGRASIFTNTQIEPGTYSSVRATLENIFDAKLGVGADPETPALLAKGNVEVWSFPGKEAKDHGLQLLRQLPRAVNDCLVKLGELKQDGPESVALELLLAKGGTPRPKPKPNPVSDGDGSWVPLGVLLGGVAATAAVGYYLQRRRR